MKTAETLQLNPSATLFTLNPTKPPTPPLVYSAHLMSPAVLCGGDFSACFPLCFMSDSRCRMLMVISELSRQMKIQLKEGKVSLGSSLSSVHGYYQLPLKRQTRAFLSVAETHTRRNSFTGTQSHHKPHDKKVKPAWQRHCGQEQLQRYLHRLISDPIPLFDYLTNC